jgi:hypothetical protein
MVMTNKMRLHQRPPSSPIMKVYEGNFTVNSYNNKNRTETDAARAFRAVALLSTYNS